MGVDYHVIHIDRKCIGNKHIEEIARKSKTRMSVKLNNRQEKQITSND